MNEMTASGRCLRHDFLKTCFKCVVDCARAVNCSSWRCEIALDMFFTRFSRASRYGPVPEIILKVFLAFFFPLSVFVSLFVNQQVLSDMSLARNFFCLNHRDNNINHDSGNNSSD